MKSNSLKTLGVAGLVVLPVLLLMLLPIVFGVGGCGPTYTVETAVVRAWVDVSGSKESTESHYMVMTDQGVFEVDNGAFLGVWNADELYGKLQAGKRYKLTVKGKRYTNFMFQYYPYIIGAEEVKLDGKTSSGPQSHSRGRMEKVYRSIHFARIDYGDWDHRRGG